MNFICVGKIVNTHGIKGEVRLISNFERKDLVFKKNFEIYIGEFHEKQVINSYRVHKNYDMLTFKNIDDINDVIIYKGELVYILRDDLGSNHLKSDLIGFNVIYNEKTIGILSGFFNNNAYEIMIIKKDLKENFVPYLEHFIKEINYDEKKIYIVNMEGLIDEDWYFDTFS